MIAVGAREHDGQPDWGGYTVDETALRHNAGVEQETTNADEAYAPIWKRVGKREPTRYREGWLPEPRSLASLSARCLIPRSIFRSPFWPRNLNVHQHHQDHPEDKCNRGSRFQCTRVCLGRTSAENRDIDPSGRIAT